MSVRSFSWRSFWSKKCLQANSPFHTLDILTGGTWKVSRETVQSWLDSNQIGPLLPHCINRYRLYLLNFWLAFMAIRFWFYILLWERDQGMIRGGQVIKPALPYYYGDVFQLLTAFSLYFNVAAGGVTTFCWISSTGFHLPTNLTKKHIKQLRWYRLLLGIQVLTRFDHQMGTSYIKLLQYVTPRQYTRYQRKFKLAFVVQKMCLKCNNIFIVLFFIIIIHRVAMHPEWNYPIIPTVIIDITYQLWYYFFFRAFFSLQVMLFLNASFVTMLLESVEDWLKHEKSAKQVLLPAVHLFGEAFHLVNDVNAFWRHHLGNYYLLLIPSIMSAVYVLLFVPTDRILFFVVWYVALSSSLTMHFNNWTAAKVRNTGYRIYRAFYHRGIIMQSNLALSTKLKMINVTQIISSSSCKFGITIGVLGTANQKVTFIIIIVMIRIFMFIIKLARNIASVEAFHDQIRP